MKGESLRLEVHREGVVIPVRAKAGAKRNAIDGLHDGALRIRVAAPPVRGKANQAICSILAEAVDVSRSQVRLLSGDSNMRKRWLVMGRTLQEVRDYLQHQLDAS